MEENWKRSWLDKRYLKFSLYLIVTALVLYLLYSLLSNAGMILSTTGDILSQILSALSPLIYGLIIAYFFSPLVNIIDRKLISRISSLQASTQRPRVLSQQFVKRRRIISIALAFVLVIIVLIIVSVTLYSMIMGNLTVEKIDNIGTNIYKYFSKYEDLFNTLSQKLSASGLAPKIKNPVQMFVDWASSGILVDFAGWLSKIGSNLINIGLGFVIAFYILKDQEYFLKLWNDFLDAVLPRKAESILMETLIDMHTIISRFFRGQLLDGVIVGVLSSIGLFLIGIDFAIFIGMFAGIANIIPYFGPIIGIVPAVIMSLLDGNVTQAVLAVVILLGIQQVDGAVIAPKVVGNSVGLHPVFVLLAVIIGGKYLGIIGMLIAVPIAAILKLFILKLYHLRQRQLNRIEKEQ